MTIYIFKRQKGSGRKTVVREIDNDFQLARDICTPHNDRVRGQSNGFWLEWTQDKEYTRNC